MRSYTIEVTGAKYVSDVVHVEAEDNPGAIIQADTIVAEEFDWDEMHSRTIVAVSNIKLPNPIDAEDIMDEIEAGYNFEPEGADLPTPGELVEELVDLVDEAGGDEELADVLGQLKDEDVSVVYLDDEQDVDFFLDEDGEQVVVDAEDYEPSENEGGVSVQSYEQDGEGM